MTTHKNVAPVIIKRKKIIVSGGHHGGAWKVAYADFVTAMMAFFMLMWLLNATTKQAQTAINAWLKQYNHIRPHQALNMKPPAPETLLKNGT
jgi:flagellar motor protein MotB